MLVAGVDLSSGEAWLLAQRLYRAGRTELAVELGRAVDVGCTHFLLTWGEHVVVLVMLEGDCPAELRELRDALWAAVTTAALADPRAAHERGLPGR
jgi:hypothetical protein